MLISNIGNAQIIDTAQNNEVAIYHVLNKRANTQLFWTFENAEIISENPTFADSIVIQWKEQTGIFTISVYEKNVNGCIGETYKNEIEIEEPTNEETELRVPNIFTPNEDGKNDYFIITSKSVLTKYEITIFNRWGRKVFETHDINYSWDGRTQGNYCSPGVYYFVIYYQTTSKLKNIKGFLHLYR